MQHAVFEGEISEVELKKLKGELQHVMDEEKDLYLADASVVND